MWLITYAIDHGRGVAETVRNLVIEEHPARWLLEAQKARAKRKNWREPPVTSPGRDTYRYVLLFALELPVDYNESPEEPGVPLQLKRRLEEDQ